MALITIDNLHIRFRGPPLLDGITGHIEPEQRIGLLGRNGTGKTTLMRILCGEIEPDSGSVIVAPSTRITLLPQDIPKDISGNVAEVVASGIASELNDDAPWQAEQQLEQIISRMELDAEALFENLSSGMKRRVLLARALAVDPDLLLLDEPTNHLDIDAINWLENFLARWKGTLMFVTHDRAFLRNTATRILEIDRGRMFDWSCDYDTFLIRKESALAAEEKQDALFDKKLAQEEVWIRQGIKARRTRNEGRVRALEEMRQDRHDRPKRTGTSQLNIQEGMRSGNLVAEASEISFAYDSGLPIVNDFSTMIMRGDKIGIIGPNGVGKTTLLKILLGQLSPDSGDIRLGTNLQIAYFDQLREQLDEEATIQENVGDGYDSISIGDRSKHVLGYLQEFLFTPERSRTQIKFLSGGERNRVLLAKLFAKPANVIILDEPTNDLDTETLELLEQRLVDFQGTVLLVSHDRAFLNNVVGSSIVFEHGTVREYVGGYDDWISQRTEPPRKDAKPTTKPSAKPKKSEDQLSRRRLGYKEQRELAALPATIEQLETEIDAFHQKMAQPEFFQQSGQEIASQQAKLKECEEQLAAAYSRWDALEK